jgi:hypothetical protein
LDASLAPGSGIADAAAIIRGDDSLERAVRSGGGGGGSGDTAWFREYWRRLHGAQQPLDHEAASHPAAVLVCARAGEPDLVTRLVNMYKGFRAVPVVRGGYADPDVFKLSEVFFFFFFFFFFLDCVGGFFFFFFVWAPS